MTENKICAWCYYARMRDDICGIYCTGGFTNPDGTCDHFRDSHNSKPTMDDNKALNRAEIIAALREEAERHPDVCLYRDAAALLEHDADPPNDPLTLEELRWIGHLEDDSVAYPGCMACSHCGFQRSVDDNFGRAVSCPNCGARMDGGVGHEA